MDRQEVRSLWQNIQRHIQQYRDDPVAAHDHNPYGKVVPALLLTATGRRTGKQRPLPLIYKKIGDSFVIVASKAGMDQHPAWYENLLANPDCHIQVAKQHYDVRARTATGAEREDLWAQMVEVLPQYEEYQSRTERQIPVVVLDPTGLTADRGGQRSHCTVAPASANALVASLQAPRYRSTVLGWVRISPSTTL